MPGQHMYLKLATCHPVTQEVNKADRVYICDTNKVM